MLTRYELGAEAIAFIRSELSQGRELATAIVDAPLERGQVVTFLPDSLGETQLTDFSSGGVASGEETRKTADLIAAYVSKGAERICVFEHPTANKDDPRSPTVSFFTVGMTVYLFMTQDTPGSQIESAAREAHWYPAIGILASLPPGERPPENRSEQDPRLLSRLAKGTDHMIVGAYDGEGWLLWSNPTAKQIA